MALGILVTKQRAEMITTIAASKIQDSFVFLRFLIKIILPLPLTCCPRLSSLSNGPMLMTYTEMIISSYTGLKVVSLSLVYGTLSRL
jgi:hypothetical protein